MFRLALLIWMLLGLVAAFVKGRRVKRPRRSLLASVLLGPLGFFLNWLEGLFEASRAGAGPTVLEANAIVSDEKPEDGPARPEQEALDFLHGQEGRFRGMEREQALSEMYDLLCRRGFNAQVARTAATRMWQGIQNRTG